jgi:hypothetical protein
LTKAQEEMGRSPIHEGHMKMLRAVSFERAEFLLTRQISEGWIESWTPDQMYQLADMIRKHARKFLCIEHPLEELELQQVDPVKAVIKRTDIAPSGILFIPEHDL